MTTGRDVAGTTVIGSCQTGALGYFADDLTVVNLDGVVNRAAYQALVQRRALDYVQSVGIRYVVDWPTNVRFLLAHSAPGADPELEPPQAVSGFQSWGMSWRVWRVRGAAPGTAGVAASP